MTDLRASQFTRVQAVCARLGLSENDTLEIQAAARRDLAEHAHGAPGAASGAASSGLWDGVVAKYKTSAAASLPPLPEHAPSSDQADLPAPQHQDAWAGAARRVVRS
ncbi:hypothetical protein [Thiorhodococcus minor]|uniref:Uncharacterized protein n=1 Tax=Thiorhodococcus minor TaxID=57489 RepID=A0A6M0JYL3_9GAMM|nr:hypothetical protein [Thiorhodococcus minor]NEV62259.1 hypothetical protein [Thiorhodococcus minor]